MTQAEETIWFSLVMEWKNALSRAFAAQIHLNDGVDASIDGIKQCPPQECSATTESLWADEAKKRYEMERFIELHRAAIGRHPLDSHYLNPRNESTATTMTTAPTM